MVKFLYETDKCVWNHVTTNQSMVYLRKHNDDSMIKYVLSIGCGYNKALIIEGLDLGFCVICADRISNCLCKEKFLEPYSWGDDEFCPICKDESENGKIDEGVIIRNCKHAFHKICILEWFKISVSCPYCRQVAN